MINFHLAQARKIFPQRFVIFIVAIFLNDSDNRLLGHKPREIINMAVGVVTGNAVPKPENIADTEIISQALLDFTAREIRIAIHV